MNLGILNTAITVIFITISITILIEIFVLITDTILEKETNIVCLCTSALGGCDGQGCLTDEGAKSLCLYGKSKNITWDFFHNYKALCERVKIGWPPKKTIYEQAIANCPNGWEINKNCTIKEYGYSCRDDGQNITYFC